MRALKPTVIVPKGQLDPEKMLNLETYGHICYQAEHDPTQESAEEFIGRIIRRGHESVIEHEKISVIILADRGVTHEIVRHRIAAYSQESTRYCSYDKGAFGREISVIEPWLFTLPGQEENFKDWCNAMQTAEFYYMRMRDRGTAAQWARSVLPQSLKAQIAVTYNMREWRHFFKLRCAADAHPQMRQIAIPLMLKFRQVFPALFGNIAYDESFPIDQYVEIIVEG